MKASSDESGVVIVIVAVMLAAMLGITAFAIDVGIAYWAKRSLQSSADAAALAGAQVLPDSSATNAVAQQYGGSSAGRNRRANVSGVTTSVATECRKGAKCKPVNAVAVTEKGNVGANFARIVGFDTFDVAARAVAVVTAWDEPWAIFAYEADCSDLGFKYNGNVFEVDGGIRSNGSFEVNGQNITAGYASSGGPNNCTAKSNGAHIDLGGSDKPINDPELIDWPAYFTTGDFSCDYTGAEFKFNKNNETIPSGVYCATKLFEANANHQKGNITVLAPEIKVDGNNQQFTPYSNGVLFFSTSSKELVLNGNSYNWTGIVFAPFGRVKINGNADSILTGLIEGLEVEVNGNAFRMTGTGPGKTKRVIQLVE